MCTSNSSLLQLYLSVMEKDVQKVKGIFYLLHTIFPYSCKYTLFVAQSFLQYICLANARSAIFHSLHFCFFLSTNSSSCSYLKSMKYIKQEAKQTRINSCPYVLTFQHFLCLHMHNKQLCRSALRPIIKCFNQRKE